MASPAYHLRQAVLCLRYSPYAAMVAAGAVAVAITFSGSALLAVRSVEAVLRGYGADARLIVFLAPGAVTDGNRLAAEAAKAAGEGARAELITPQAALARLKSDLGEQGHALDGLAVNPLPPSIEVRLANTRLAKGDLSEVKLAAARLRKLPFAREVDDGSTFVDRLETLLAAVRAIGTGVFVIILCVALFLVGNVVRLAIYARRDEIDILRLVGATDAFIATPFVIEGSLQGLGGGVVAAVLLKAGEIVALPKLTAIFGFGADLLPAPSSAGTLAVFVLLGVGVGFLAELRGGDALPVEDAVRRAPAGGVLLVLSVLVGASNARAVEKAAPTEQLRELNEEKDKVEALLRDIETKRSSAITVLDGIEKDVRAAQTAATDAHRKATASASKLKAAREMEAVIEKQREEAAEELGPRLLLRYRLRGASYLQALLLAPSIGDFLWRRRMIDRILRSDFELIDRLANLQQQATDARTSVETQRTELTEAEKSAHDRADEAKKRRSLQVAVVGGVMKERGAFLRTMSELDHARQDLAKTIAHLPAPPEGLGGFEHERGRLAWPAQGEVSVPFGRQVDPKFKTVLQHKGVDIDARDGAEVHTPYGAVVAYAGWFSGFGNLIILDHGEGYYTLYAHLREMKVEKGARIEEGAAIGTVGDTGSLRGSFLYFEIRSGSKALDPQEWLIRK